MRNIGGVKFRRRREAVTDYRKRLGLVKGGIDRIVIRKTNKRIISQIIRYSPQGDKVVAHADSSELLKFKWPSRSNRATAYLTGLLLAKKAKKEAGADHILDIGISSPVANSVPFIFAKGCIDGGMKLRSTITVDDKKYNLSETKHIAEMKAKDASRYQKHYSGYIKEGHAPESLSKMFNETKDRIMKE